jgi:uncharacterized membrane-anchored protein
VPSPKISGTALALLLLALPAAGQDAPEEGQDEAQRVLDSFPWQREGTAKLGSQANLTIPPTFRFLSGAQASKLVEKMGNLSSHKELGLIGTDDLGRFVLFFDDVGFVKDDGRTSSTPEDSRRCARTWSPPMRAQGHNLDELNFDGWAIPRATTRNQSLEWAIASAPPTASASTTTPACSAAGA